MSINLRSLLENHLQQKVSNHEWLTKSLNGDVSAFPYRPSESGQGTIGELIAPTNPSTDHTPPSEDTNPRFVVNIPLAHPPNAVSDYSYLRSRLNLLKNESYGTTNNASNLAVKKSVSVVIGINQIESIDPAVNRAFKTHLKNVPKIDGIVHRIIGFFWKPLWEKSQKGSHIHSLAKSFLLLKALSANAADNVRRAHEMPKGLHPNIGAQIPFQRIRETIKNVRETRDFVENAERSTPQAPIYYTVMDADFQALRAGTGLFSRLESAIKEKNTPSAVCLGYQVASNELPLIQLGVKMDMAVRKAMASIFPYAAYLCEPCTAFIARRPGTPAFLHRLSFIGNGRTLETRRFVESGLARGLFDQNVAYIADGGVTTTTPSRMFTLKNRKFTTLSKSQVRQKQCLQALRAIPQTHATPKQWADNLYSGLDFSCPRVTDATTPMMYLFNVFDPISRMFTESHFSQGVFTQVMSDYDKPLSAGLQSTLNTARATLLQLGMKKAMVDQIEMAARRSGKAIFSTLQEATQ